MVPNRVSDTEASDPPPASHANLPGHSAGGTPTYTSGAKTCPASSQPFASRGLCSKA